MKVFAVLTAWALWVWTLNLPESVKASLFWIDTIDEKPGMYQPTAHNRVGIR